MISADKVDIDEDDELPLVVKVAGVWFVAPFLLLVVIVVVAVADLVQKAWYCYLKLS